MEVSPRPYQSEAVKAALEGLRGPHKRALVVLATGLGKTLTAAFIAKKFRAKKILFLVHNNFILEHAADEFKRVFSKKTRMAIYNGISRDGAKSVEIVFATWQTMGSKLREWPKNYFNLIIVDEAHHAEAETYKPVVKHFSGAKLAITATPDRTDGADIRDLFGSEVVDVTLEEAIARGWLPRIEYHVITDESLDENELQKIATEIREGKKRFTMAEVNRRIFIKKREAEIAKIINKYSEKAVVFCASIAHAERMARWLNSATTFHSKKGKNQNQTWDRNQAALNALRDGTTTRVCAVDAFNEGVNVPSVGLVAFCRVTGAITIFRQQLGRGLRPGKDKLVVLDFVGNLERVRLVMEMMNSIADYHERCTSRKEIEREGYTRQKFEVSGKGFEFTFSDQIVDVMEILEHCQKDFYPTWQEAAQAARNLGIGTSVEYKKRYGEDSSLPSNPNTTYLDFPGYPVFLGSRKVSFYQEWRQATASIMSLGIETQREYYKRYKEDPRLPSNPKYFYVDFPGWSMYLRGSKKRKSHAWRNYYTSLKDAQTAARELGILTCTEYYERYREDPKLPSASVLLRIFPNFPGWPKFLGKE